MAGGGVVVVDGPVMETTMPSKPWGRLLLEGLGFPALTVGVFWWLLARFPASHAAPALGDLRWGYFVFLLLALPIESVTSAARIWRICRVTYLAALAGFLCLGRALARDASRITPRQLEPR